MMKIFFFLVLISFVGGAMYLSIEDVPITQKKVIKAVKIPVTVE